MARTARYLAALALTISVGLSGGSDVTHSQGGTHAPELDGKKLFERETFGGNGRTCRTCHSKDNGTLTLADVQRIIEKADPDDPFLIHDALDDDGAGTTRVQTHGTIRVTIPLPPWVSSSCTTDAPPRCRSRRLETSTTTRRTRWNRPTRSSMPLQTSSEPTRASSPRPTSGRSPRAECRLSCRRGVHQPKSVGGCSSSTRRSPLPPKPASAPCVTAVRC